MKVLVIVASRHGSTSMIGEAIREELVATGVTTHLLEPEGVTDISQYDAVVLGSAVYAGRWLKPARAFARRFEAELTKKPVWLFSSGPVGEPPKPAQPAADALELVHRLGARDHQVFEGRIEPDVLGFGERAAVRVIGAETGDFRPWVAITVWARSISSALKAELPAPVGAV
jgi:menaquinone-dependent protoporphyrinogen oxidase